MKATITYLLSERAQRAQMAATGQAVARRQTMTEEIDLAQWADFPLPLLEISDDGRDVSVDLSPMIHLDRNGAVICGGVYGCATVAHELDAQPASGIEAMGIIAGRIEDLRLSLSSTAARMT